MGKKITQHIIWISSFLECINIYLPSMVSVFLKCQKANMRTDRLLTMLTKLLKTKSTKFLRRALNRNNMKTPTKELIQITAVRINLISPRVKWSCHDRSIKILFDVDLNSANDKGFRSCSQSESCPIIRWHNMQPFLVLNIPNLEQLYVHKRF